MTSFDGIPKFPTAKYAVDVPWNHIEENLEILAGSGELRLDPDYQREHVWTQEQQISFVEFQLMGGDISRTLVFNAPHWNEVGGKEQFVELVDGKQRLEAVRAFMRGDIPAFGLRVHEYEGSFPTLDYRLRFQVCCLRTREEVLGLYLKINAGGTPHSKAELDRVREMLEKERGA